MLLSGLTTCRVDIFTFGINLFLRLSDDGDRGGLGILILSGSPPLLFMLNSMFSIPFPIIDGSKLLNIVESFTAISCFLLVILVNLAGVA